MSRNNRIFIGNLSMRCTKKDVMSNFEVFGEIVKCDMKEKYAFVEYRDAEACKDAIRNMHNVDLRGRNLIVEMSHSRGPRSFGGPRDDSYRDRDNFRDSFRERGRDHFDRRDRDYGRSRRDDIRGGRDYYDRRDFRDERDYRSDRRDYRGRDDRYDHDYRGRRERSRGRDEFGRRQRDDFRDQRDSRRNGAGEHYRSNSQNFIVQIENMPEGVSWQDLKDFAREQVGSSVVRTDISHSNGKDVGIVEFSDRGDYDYALDHLNGKKMRGNVISVIKYSSSSPQSRKRESLSRSKSFSRSPSMNGRKESANRRSREASPSYNSRSRSRRRDLSLSKSRSRSPSRSRSQSETTKRKRVSEEEQNRNGKKSRTEEVENVKK